jgi:ABC-2 type transport system permease protein
MTAFQALVRVTVRALLGRRRTLLIGLLASLPVLVAVLIRIGGGRPDAAAVLDTLVIRTVLPLVALVLGTAALGSEIDDGTVIFQLLKPIARWRIALAKTTVAAGLTAALVLPPMIVTGLLLGGTGGASIGLAAGFTLAALAGGAAYAVGFTALGLVTSRALILGLGYTLVWEGVLAGILEGTRFLSVRQATLGVAAALTGMDVGVDPLTPLVSLVILVAVTSIGFGIAALRLRTFQVRAAD